MATRAGLLIAILVSFAPAASPADPPPFRASIEAAVKGPAEKARTALRELEACEDPAALPALLEAAPKIDAALASFVARAAKAMSRRHPETVVLDAIAASPADAAPVCIAILADLIEKKRVKELAARLRTEAAGVLARPVAETGRYEAPDLILAALAESEGIARLHLILSLGQLQGFEGRVIPVLRKLRDAGKPEETEAILGAVIRFRGQRTVAWLVEEAMGDGLEPLAAVFDAPSRTDVLRKLVDRVPQSIPALTRLTGREFGASTHLWLKWIDEIEARATAGESAPGRPADAAPAPRTDQPPRARPRFYGIPIPEGDFVLLLDASESMSQRENGVRRIDAVKEKVEQVLEALPATQRFNIVFFNRYPRRFRNGCTFVTPQEVRLAKEWMTWIRPAGRTNLGTGLRAALADRRVGEIILLSDGMPNAGTVRNAQDVVRALGGRAVKIHTVSPPRRDGSPNSMMKRIADLTGGIASTF